MRQAVFMFILATTVVISAHAKEQSQTESQCAEKVEAFLSGIEVVREVSGVEKRSFGLTVQEVRKLQAEKGSCATSDEIQKRMWASSK